MLIDPTLVLTEMLWVFPKEIEAKTKTYPFRNSLSNLNISGTFKELAFTLLHCKSVGSSQEETMNSHNNLSDNRATIVALNSFAQKMNFASHRNVILERRDIPRCSDVMYNEIATVIVPGSNFLPVSL